ncbi:MAG: prepilin-type N-terminal cleavage/methylation domain-containing protein [Verrucomicrobiota bacterium]|nr:prepilin-type N-terminal cleavage/methylation domain-containing protein [Verrucomicrobiota bacterium]
MVQQLSDSQHCFLLPSDFCLFFGQPFSEFTLSSEVEAEYKPHALIPLAVSAPTTTSHPCRTPAAADCARRRAFTLPGLRERSGAFTLQEQRGRSAFTLVEMLVVIVIIAIVIAFLVPALAPNSGRALYGATRQFAADLENARQIAIAERTRTRVLLPLTSSDFASPTPAPTPWPGDITRRGYVITSQKPTETTWKQRGKWTRLPTGIALQDIVQPSPSPTPSPIPIDIAGTGTINYTFNGPYIEFLPNGSSSLNPGASPASTATLADGFVDTSGAFKAKNVNVKSTVTIDPLTGNSIVK